VDNIIFGGGHELDREERERKRVVGCTLGVSKDRNSISGQTIDGRLLFPPPLFPPIPPRHVRIDFRSHLLHSSPRE